MATKKTKSTKKITIKKTKSNAPLLFQMDADAAVKKLLKLRTELNPDTEIQPDERRSANPLQRIPLEAVESGVRIMQANPDSFRDFDVAGARDAIAYERAMVAVADSARQLAKDLDTSILKRRSAAVRQTLAMYESLKGIARVRGALHDDVKKLRDLVATHVGPNAASPEPAVATPEPAPAPKPATTQEPAAPAATTSASSQPPVVLN